MRLRGHVILLPDLHPSTAEFTGCLGRQVLADTQCIVCFVLINGGCQRCWCLDQRAVTAPEVMGWGAPLLLIPCFQRQVICYHTCARVLLCKKSVVQVALPIIGVLCIASPAVENMGQPHHVVHSAVLLIVLAEPSRLLEGRCPSLPIGLASSDVETAVGDGALPICFHHIAPALFTSDFPSAGSTYDFGDRGIGMEVCKHILPPKKGIKEAAAPIPVHELKVAFISGLTVEVRPDFQHSTRFEVKHIGKFLIGEPVCPTLEPAQR